MPTCKDIFEHASDYRDGAVEPGEADAFRQHLELCPPCRNFYQSFDTTVRLAREAVLQEVPPDLADRVLEGVRARMKSA